MRLVDYLYQEKYNCKIQRLIKTAKFRFPQADRQSLYFDGRTLNHEAVTELMTCQYVHSKHSIVLQGYTGSGKTFLACALGKEACRQQIKTRYIRLPDLLMEDGDTVLIAEGCTHHRQCGDIGSVKIPAWLSEYTGKELIFKTVSGTEYPEDLRPYAMVVHCGGCMLNEREVSSRAKNTVDQNVPITNYGTMIAFVHGILKRSLGIFPELEEQL